MDDDDARRVICGVIAQAIEDYRDLVALGRIVNGKAVRTRRAVRVIAGYGNIAEVESLLVFFEPGGLLDKLLVQFGIQINPRVIRRRLGLGQ